MRIILRVLFVLLLAEIGLIIAIKLGWLDKKETMTEAAIRMDATIHLPESPAAAKFSLIPHPKPPSHLKMVELDISFGQLKNSIVRIEQKRAKDGWYMNGVRDIKNGRLRGSVEIDPTWRDPAILLFILVDKTGRQLDSMELRVSRKEMESGKIVSTL